MLKTMFPHSSINYTSLIASFNSNEVDESIIITDTAGTLEDDLFYGKTNSSMTLITTNSTSGDLDNGTIFVFVQEGLPLEFREMSQSSKNSVVAYSFLFIIALAGNLTVFVSVFKEYRKQRGRIPLLILHLSVADLIVCLCLIPIEIIWRVTIQWYGGDVLCKLCQFLRAFGLYLSSMVVICISLDRFFAILYPFKTIEGRQRVKIMLWMAWIASGVFSAPQVIFFGVESHPHFPSFKQCVTSSFLAQPEDARLYSIFFVSAMYFAPLVVIIFTYTAILVKIMRKSRESTGISELRRPLRPSSSSSISDRGGSYRLPNRRRRLTDRRSLRGEMPRDSNPWRKNKGGIGTMTNPNVTLPSQMTCPSSSLNPSAPASQGMNISRSLLLEKEVKSFRASSSSSLSVSRDSSYMGIGSGGGPCSSTDNSSDIKSNGNGKAQLILRMSGNAVINISRAKTRTLKMTIGILFIFLLCWTPYVVMTLWYMFDRNGAKKVDPKIQDGLFIMAVCSSCCNPLVYGTFSRNSCRGVSKDLTRQHSCRFT